MTEIKYGGTIEHIKSLLEKYTLDKDAGCLNLNPHFLKKEDEEKYKGCASIWGNFVEYSNAFSIYTDDKKIINEMKKYFIGKIKGGNND